MNLLIVDDEHLFTRGLALLVDWKDFGFDKVTTADNALDALEIMERERPSLVLTDIRMPGMNGLDMIRNAQKIVPDAAFIIISGYSDYTYVRSAFQLNVFDYIEKPVTIEQVAEVMQKFSEARKELSEKSHAILQRLVLDTLRTCMLNGELSQHEMNQIWGAKTNSVVMPTFAQAIIISGSSIEAVNLLKDRIAAVLSQMDIVTVSCTTGNEVILFAYALRFNEAARSMAAIVKRVCQKALENGSTVHIGIGQSGTFLNFAVIVREAKFALEYARFFDEPFLSIDDVEYSTHLPASLHAGEKNLCFLLRLGDREGVQKQVRELLSNLVRASVSMDLFVHEALELIYLGLQALKEADIGYERESFVPHQEIQKYQTAEEISEWVYRSFDDILRSLERQNHESGRERVQWAKKYIDDHYGEAITLEELSDMCGMHQAYFSTLFKTEIGQSYVKYINMVRMQHAAEMLLANMPLKKVAALTGFNNTRYFCDRFRQYWGYTPTEYKKGPRIRKEDV